MDPFLLTAIGSAAMAAAALVTSWANYRNRKAGADKTASEAWATLLAPLQERVAVLEYSVKELTLERDSLRVQVMQRDQKIATLEARGDMLTPQIVALGTRPCGAGGCHGG